jgi:uncharacterized phage protein gp47/JayE
MIRKIIADTPLNDINQGGVLLSLLEAAAANDFENNTAILNVLELLNIDALRNNDLDAYASNFGLVRLTATKASGFVTVSDTSITKRSTTLYPVKPAPITGTSTIFVNDASGWNQAGTLYIGRGTPNFEGPISYSSIVDNGTFYTINLDSSLEKDHLLSEVVVDGQGTTDRQILAGTTIKIPANNIQPEVQYTTLRDAVIPAGEDLVTDIPVTAVQAGSSGNAGINSITLFESLPFVGASVTNTNAFTNGRDTETDEVFRNRVKAYSSTLARGTKRSILASIDGVSEETEGKQVASAVITEPADIGEPSIVYIDDGSGFEPSFEGQSVDLLVASSSGNEEFLQLANYPLPRPQVINNEDAPFLLQEGMELKVLVDGIEEAVTFTESDFRSISSATISEVVVAINDRANLFKARLTSDSTRILLYPVEYKAETIQVVSSGGILDANNILKFPVNEFSYIALYKNNDRLREVERSASVISNPISTWDISGVGNLIVSVDDTPDQDRSFDTPDFGGLNFNALTISDWVNAFNAKYAGLTATASTTGRLILTSNREGSQSKIEIVGGSYIEKMFGGQELISVGQDSDFALNRQNGNLQLAIAPQEGDVITAGSSDTKGDVISGSASAGNFNVSTDANGRPSDMVIVVDANEVTPRVVNLAVGSSLILTDEGSNTMRIMANTASAFKEVQAGDYIYITNRGDIDNSGTGSWIDIKSCGLFKVTAKGEHTSDGVDTYIETINKDMVIGGPYAVEDGLDFQAFYSDKYPQLWRGTMTSNPAAAPLEDVVASLNNNIRGITAQVFRTNFIKMTSVTEEGGSIAVPVSVGNCPTQLFATGISVQTGTPSHIANRVQDTDVFSTFQRTEPTNTNVWLDRYTYTDVKGKLTADTEPSKDGSGTYSEILEDTNTDFEQNVTYDNSVGITSGQNKQQTRNIRTIIDADNLGTRHSIPRTLMDYNIDDEYQILKNLEFSSEDNLVAIIDNDAVAKTIDIQFSRTGRINSGSQGGIFLPSNLEFSADDADNEPGIDFGTLDVWGKLPTQSSTEFADYAVWFKARNWYDANGSSILLRAGEFGPLGDKIKFTVDYPSVPDAAPTTFHINSADETLVVYSFGSDGAILTDVSPGAQFTVEDLGSDNFRLTFPASATVTNINIGDILSISEGSGFSAANSGVFRVNDKNDTLRTVDIYNPNGQATIFGNQEIQTVQTVADVADSLDGTYFVVTAPNGDTIKFWYDNNDSGTIEPDIGTTTRSYEVNVATGDTAIDVATATAAALLNDPAITTATNGAGTLDTVTFTFTNNGPSVVGVDGTPATGFTFGIDTAGILDTYETVNVIAEFQAFPINTTDTATICETVTDGGILEAVEIISGTIIKATREETGVAINELSYGHNPDPLLGLHNKIGMYDSKSWVLSFENSNPNFTLKTQLLLNGVSPNYTMDTAPNLDGTTGEYFKLVPTTINNIYHQLTNRALSQLDIVADVAISNCGKKIQIKSEQLGSNGAIEIVGGRATEASFLIIGDSQVSQSNGSNYLEMKIPASPNTLTPGQHVVLQNESGVERLNRQAPTDTMDVVKINDETFEYRYNNKATNFNQYVEFEIVDANSVDPVSYPTPGVVWRWSHSDAGSTINLVDVANGVVANQPAHYNEDGTITGGGTNIVVNINDSGSVSTPVSFTIVNTGQPAQADYITFENTAGNTWAVWFDIDGNGTAPTGATYLSATNQIQVSILSTSTPNQIMSALTSALLTGGIIADFNIELTPAASLATVEPGNVVNPIGTLTGWDSSNISYNSGDSIVGGYTVVNVDADNDYMDVVNPNGKAMASTAIGAGTVLISSTPAIEWKLAHSSRVEIISVSVLSGVATATTLGPHKLNVGDTFSTIDIVAGGEPSVPGTGTGTVIDVLGPNQFTYATAAGDSNNLTPGGFLLKTGDAITRYKIEELGYNNLFRLSRADGDSPLFKSCGVAVDDILVIGGTTFNAINSSKFRIWAVDEDSIIYQNANAIEELDTLIPFNNFATTVNWVANSNQVTGVAGAFSNLNIGDWVKKTTDEDFQYRQVVGFDTGVASTATAITLGSNYDGITATTTGISLDQNSSIGTGLYLQNVSDIRVYEGDSVDVNDVLFISENTNPNWFEVTNSGTFTINAWGTDTSDGRMFLRVQNASGLAETNVQQDVENTKLSITESDDNKFSTVRQISHVAIDEFNPDRRVLYLSPGNRSYKWSQSNVTSVSALGKMNYSQDVVTGVDGYLYYTGLLRKVQRIIDGFEPDPTNFPGRKAVGSLIETLPPLPRRVNVAIDVTTRDGVNLSEISDEITSSIINYVSDLGVGEDVILSDIIVRVKNIDGVAAVTFITPEPSEERVPISSNEKAFIEADDISIA